MRVIEHSRDHAEYTAEVSRLEDPPPTTYDQRLADRLAAFAGLTAALAVVATRAGPDYERAPGLTTRAGPGRN